MLTIYSLCPEISDFTVDKQRERTEKHTYLQEIVNIVHIQHTHIQTYIHTQIQGDKEEKITDN